MTTILYFATATDLPYAASILIASQNTMPQYLLGHAINANTAKG